MAPIVPDRPPPGPLPGGLLGAAAGCLLGWLWSSQDPEAALAVSLVFVGLVAAVATGAPRWRPFAIAMLVVAVLTTGVLVGVAAQLT